MKHILVTGGAGYIGSHTCVEMVKAGYMPVIFDNLVNSHKEAVARICELTGKDIPFIQGDVLDGDAVRHALETYQCDGVIHFAGLKAVGESSVRALDYYENNFVGTHVLLKQMKALGISKIVFSSSATVYGIPKFLPYTEDHPCQATNPYGQTKLSIELMLNDVTNSGEVKDVAILRYFNPIGAHPSGRIGEAPNGIPNNLLPYVAQVATGKREKLSVFGGDYETRDGTGVRDYLHVVDLARAHIKALTRLDSGAGAFTVNLGTGQGVSVLDIVKAFETVNNIKVPYSIEARRPGDIAEFYADASLAAELLDWKAELGLEDMCRDLWNWQRNNPNGYDSE